MFADLEISKAAPKFPALVEQESVERLGDKLEKRLQEIILGLQRKIAKDISERKLADAVAWGSDEQVFEQLGLETFDDELNNALRQFYFSGIRESGDNALKYLPASIVRKQAVPRPDKPFVFNPLDDEVMAWVRENAGAKVTAISEKTQQAIRRVMIRAQEQGLTSREISRLLAQVGGLGLTERQGLAVLNYRQRLVDEGVTVGEANKRAQVLGFDYIRQRAKSIAITETTEAISQGRQAVWEQLEDQGYVDPVVATKEWITARDERVCPICGPLDGLAISVRDSFDTVGNPPAHVNCRCTMILRPEGRKTRRPAWPREAWPEWKRKQ